MIEVKYPERGDDHECPRYEIVYDRPRRKRWAICVFVINEGAKIRKQLQAMSASNKLTRAYYDKLVKTYIKDWRKNLAPIAEESA